MNEKRVRGEGAQKGAGRQWRGSEGAGRPVGGFGCGSAVVEGSERGGQCGHHHLVSSVLCVTVRDALIVGGICSF